MSSPPPPYQKHEDTNDTTLKANPTEPQKAPKLVAFAAPKVANIPITRSNLEANAPLVNDQALVTPSPYATAPNTPLLIPTRYHVSTPYPTAQAMPTFDTPVNGGVVGADVSPCAASSVAPMKAPMACGPMQQPLAPGMLAYPGMLPMQPIGVPAMQPGQQQTTMGSNPLQNGAINLVVNTNANANSEAGAKGASNGMPAPRPCPKCRLGYITRGQARFRETCIKALAYATVCCTCFLPLRLLKTNYVDKCSYCGEEYGFRGELFEKPKPRKT